MNGTTKNYPKDSAKSFVANTVARHFSGVTGREVFRNQIKVLTITVFFAMVGIALGRNAEEFGWVLLIAVLFVGFMYIMDTSLLDLNKRELVQLSMLNEYLLDWDNLTATQINSAVADAGVGVEKSNKWKKVCLAFKFRANDWLWYGLPMIIVAMVLVVRWYLVGK